MVFEKVKEIIVSTLKLDPSKVTLEASLEHDLGADSLDAVEVIMALEDEFDIEISDDASQNIKTVGDYRNKHEHIVFTLEGNEELRYMDTRKFGKMHLIKKDELYTSLPLSELGLEPWDQNLNKFYLFDKFKNKKTAIKTTLLDQTIIAGIGNIYADEILYFCKLNPQKRTCDLKEIDLENIIKYTRKVLEEAIQMGGTTIRSYTSSEGVHGRFQQNLKVHNNKGKKCENCNVCANALKSSLVKYSV